MNDMLESAVSRKLDRLIESINSASAKDAKSKDRVDISLSDYNGMKDRISVLLSENDCMRNIIKKLGIPIDVISVIPESIVVKTSESGYKETFDIEPTLGYRIEFSAKRRI